MYMVCQFPYSLGNCLHEHPDESMYKMASSTCLSEYLGDLLFVGNSGSMTAYCVSVSIYIQYMPVFQYLCEQYLDEWTESTLQQFQEWLEENPAETISTSFLSEIKRHGDYAMLSALTSVYEKAYTPLIIALAVVYLNALHLTVGKLMKHFNEDRAKANQMLKMQEKINEVIGVVNELSASATEQEISDLMNRIATLEEEVKEAVVPPNKDQEDR